MGLVGKRRPPLPAPTESLSGIDNGASSPEEGFASPIALSDLETNLTTHTDKTSYEVPEDGSPVTINTTKKTRERDDIGQAIKSKKSRTKGRNDSQTSLLIEYFEEGRQEGHRPSVRVRVTPSKKNKEGAGNTAQGSVRITEQTAGTRKPSYTRSISLGQGEAGVSHVLRSNISNLDSGSELSGGHPPVEVEVRNMGVESDLSRLDDEGSRFMPINQSEVSSMPADSLLESAAMDPPLKLNRRRSRSLERGTDSVAFDTLKPKQERTRSLSREREFARRAVEKVKEREHKRGSSGRHKVRTTKEYAPGDKPRRKSSKSYDKEDLPTSANPSVLTGSNISGVSGRSAESTASSIKNPKLLQTVEDAIRRLILPEINALKNEQKSNRRSSRYDDEASPASSVRSDELRSTRKASGPKLKLNGDTIKSQKGSRRSGGKEMVDSPDREIGRSYSEDSLGHESKSRRRSKDKVRDAAIGAAAAGLTAAALKSKDSASSIERRERRKRRSKSHSRTSSRAESRTDSQADSADGFTKHNVPPMPMASHVGYNDSDITRDSILSERTSTPTNERTRAVRDLVRDESTELSPGGSDTPTRQLSPVHERFQENSEEEDDGPSRNDVYDSVHLRREPVKRNLADEYPHDDEYDSDEYVTDPYPQQRAYVPQSYMDPNYSNHSPSSQRVKRGLSPIQSVASYEERGEDPPAVRNSMHQARSVNSLSSADRNLHVGQSNESLQSSVERDLEGKQMRPKPLNFETARETLHGQQSPVNNVVGGRLGQNVRMVGSNPELVATPHGVESAVASLLGPSTVGGQSNVSYESDERGSNRHSLDREQRRDSFASLDRNLHTPERSSPLKRELNPNDLDDRMMSPSYRHELRQSSLTPSRDRPDSNRSSPFIEKPMTFSAIPRGTSPLPEAMDYDDEDIETNPSPIQGPGAADTLTGGVYGIKGQHSKNSSVQESLRLRAKELLVAATGAGAGAAIVQGAKEGKLDHWNRASYPSPPQSEGRVRGLSDSPSHAKQDAPFTPWQPDYTPLMPATKDEGYSSGLPPKAGSARSLTPDYRISKGMPTGIFNNLDMGGDVQDDPFSSPGRQRPMTGRSDAMSPLYEAATGHGLDRIQNKDIVALMDHMTVRDSQRNARDTEILMTLVRSAAEMRNSFEDMKRFVDGKNNAVVNETREQGNQTRRAIGGPRAMPSKGLSSKASEDMTDDIPDKRRNVFRRALQGLGGGNKQNLGRIEDMLMELLEEVAEIKTAQQQQQQQAPAVQADTYAAPLRSSGLTSYEQLRDAPMAPAESYQPSGRAFAEPRNDSGYSSANSSYRPGYPRPRSEALHASQNRVSTVAEAENEDEDEDETPLDERDQKIIGSQRIENQLTPTREIRGDEFAGPPVSGGARSIPEPVEATPNTRKHRSGSSGFVQKISRWSKTTTSSIPGIDATPTRAQRNSVGGVTGNMGARDRPVSELSRSASDIADDYNVHDHYDPNGDDRLRSKTSLSARSEDQQSQSGSQYRPPSPLIPSNVSMNEKPTYRAHRDSKDLQHPQPRQGPTAKYQNHLETEAARHMFEHENVDSPSSDVLGSNPVLSRFGGRETGNRYSGVSAGGELSTINEGSSHGPNLPPKIKDQGPLIPPKVPIAESGEHGKNVSFSTHMANANTVPARKPMGARPIARSGSYSPPGGMSGLAEYKTQYGNNQGRIDSDNESETF